VSEIGLRERKKFATKEALSRAALELTIQRGLDAATAESIAEVAGVSTRTFHNYFSCKEDAVLFMLDKSVEEMIDGFMQRSPEETVLDSLETILIDFFESADGLEWMIAVTRLMADHPTLIARHVAMSDSKADAMLAEIGRRTGTDPETDLYPRLVYHASAAVARAVLELHINAGNDAAPPRPILIEAIREGYASLRRGLPQPAQAGRCAGGQ
jgi:AcrR family transcriptional regulator